MGEIAQLLEQKGLSPELSQDAENAVIQLVKSKVPPQFQGMLDEVLGGQQTAGADGATSSGGLGSLLGMAEGLLGKHNA
jgi:hypothetical protein